MTGSESNGIAKFAIKKSHGIALILFCFVPLHQASIFRDCFLLLHNSAVFAEDQMPGMMSVAFFKYLIEE